MSNAQVKSFFLALNHDNDFRPNHARDILIGDIIKDPHKPRECLLRSEPVSDKVEIYWYSKYLWRPILKGGKPNLSDRVRRFFDPDLDVKPTEELRLLASDLETTTLKEASIVESLKDCCSYQDLEKLAKGNTLYMVTGLKTASRCWIYHETPEGTTSHPVAENVNLAYRLIKIKFHGGKVDFENYTKGAHFFLDDRANEDWGANLVF